MNHSIRKLPTQTRTLLSTRELQELADNYLTKHYGLTWDDFPDVIALADIDHSALGARGRISVLCKELVRLSRWYR